MSGPDLEIETDPEAVWRVGYEPNPWVWTPWSYAADGGLFAGRWDDQKGNFRTLYTCSTLLGCFLELLAKFRPDTALEAELAEIDDPAGQAAVDPDTAGAIGYDWVADRRYGPAQQTGAYCLITHSRSVAALTLAGVLAPLGIAAWDIDVALLKAQHRRVVTRTVASWLYDLRDEHRRPLVDGVAFHSRHGDELRMWAIFERLTSDQMQDFSEHVQPGDDQPVTPELPDLVEAMRRHGLHWS